MSAALQALAGLREGWCANAQPLPEPQPPPRLWHGVLVRLAEQSLLLPHDGLDSLIPCPPVSPIPGTRPFVLGLAAWQGVLLPVLSGEMLCGEPSPAAGGARGHCLVLHRGGLHFAMTLSEVKGPVALPAEDFFDELPAGTICSDWCSGHFSLSGHPVPVLHVDQLLADPRLMDTASTGDRTEESHP